MLRGCCDVTCYVIKNNARTPQAHKCLQSVLDPTQKWPWSLTYARGVRPSPVRVRLLSFGPLRHAFAEGGEWYELAPDATVATLLGALESDGKLSAEVLHAAAIAVKQEYASA